MGDSRKWVPPLLFFRVGDGQSENQKAQFGMCWLKEFSFAACSPPSMLNRYRRGEAARVTFEMLSPYNKHRLLKLTGAAAAALLAQPAIPVLALQEGPGTHTTALQTPAPALKRNRNSTRANSSIPPLMHHNKNFLRGCSH